MPHSQETEHHGWHVDRQKGYWVVLRCAMGPFRRSFVRKGDYFNITRIIHPLYA